MITDLDRLYIDKQINKLLSPNFDKRYEACENLRLAATITPEAVSALKVAVNDTNEAVAKAARKALETHLAPVQPPLEQAADFQNLTPPGPATQEYAKKALAELFASVEPREDPIPAVKPPEAPLIPVEPDQAEDDLPAWARGVYEEQEASERSLLNQIPDVQPPEPTAQPELEKPDWLFNGQWAGTQPEETGLEQNHPIPVAEAEPPETPTRDLKKTFSVIKPPEPPVEEPAQKIPPGSPFVPDDKVGVSFKPFEPEAPADAPVEPWLEQAIAPARQAPATLDRPTKSKKKVLAALSVQPQTGQDKTPQPPIESAPSAEPAPVAGQPPAVHGTASESAILDALEKQNRTLATIQTLLVRSVERSDRLYQIRSKVIDMDMPLLSMLLFSLKWFIASLPVLVVLGLLLYFMRGCGV